jgi:aminocarboxymuconate-semialdehyde decarboxylase
VTPRAAAPGHAVDIHSHFFPPRFLDALGREGARHGVGVEARDGERWVWSSPRQAARLGPLFYDAGARLQALDRWGLAAQALSLSPPMLYWAPPALGRELASIFNQELAAICAAHPGRLIPLATLPLQDVEAAAAEAERSARGGCRGLYLGTNVNGRYLDDPAFTPLWEAAARLRLPVFTHPLNNAGEDRMAGWHLANAVGNPGETALCAARLIMAGVLDRFRDLPFVLAHGGGSLPFIAGRLDHAYAVREECRTAIPAPPSAYLRRFHYDTITFHDDALRLLIRAAGPQRVMLGTDQAYDMADADAPARVARLGLDPAAAHAVLAGNAARLLALEVPAGEPPNPDAAERVND